jgi:chromosome segregation ATPase
VEQSKLQISQLEAIIKEKDEQLKEVSEEKQEELRQKSEQNSALFDQLQTMGAELRALKHGISQDREGSSTPGGQLNTRYDFISAKIH